MLWYIGEGKRYKERRRKMMDVEGGYLFKPETSKWQEKPDARLSVEKLVLGRLSKEGCQDNVEYKSTKRLVIHVRDRPG